MSERPLHPLLDTLVKQQRMHPKKAYFLNEKRKVPAFQITTLLLKEKWFTQAEIVSILTRTLFLPEISLRAIKLNELPSLFSHAFMQTHRVVLLKQNDCQLELGMTDPLNPFLLQFLRFKTQRAFSIKLIRDEELDALLEHQNNLPSWQELLNQQLTLHPHTEAASFEERMDTPLTQFIEELIIHAAEQRASDIHFNPLQHHYTVRIRTEGQLKELVTLPLTLAKRVIFGLKILSQVDVTEKRLPQDGRIDIDSLPHIHIRCAFCPSLLGEKAALRFLRREHLSFSFHELGFSPSQIKVLLHYLHHKEGMIISSGKTGAGKTTTLYTMLNYLNQTHKHICTIEHPVEYLLSGATQLHVQHHLGFDFAQGLRALLRHDPDVILIGEIRDAETANIALQAAETGHLVLASLHAKDTASAYFRLKHLCHHPESLQALSLIVGQSVVQEGSKERTFELLEMNANVHAELERSAFPLQGLGIRK